nr:hypothetical protein [Tanacetum cinerariifolium]
MDQQNPTLAKIPILDTGKFEQWQFRIQQYLQHEHYALWEVIEFGDSYEAPTGKKKGRTVTLTTDDMQKRKNDVKARTTLLLALHDEHQLRFSKHKTVQELWAAILKTFGDWRTNASKDGMLAEGTYSVEAVRALDTDHRDLFNLIRAPNPTKVKTGSHPRTPHEVLLLTLTATRVIKMDDAAATTDLSEMPLSEDVPATAAPEAGQAEESSTTDPPTAQRAIKEAVMGPMLMPPLKSLRRDHADPRPSGSSHRGKVLLPFNWVWILMFLCLKMLLQGSVTRIRYPLLTLRHAIPLMLPTRDPKSENASSPVEVGSTGSVYRSEWGVTNGSLLDTPEACQDLVDHVAPPGYFSELRHMHNDEFLKQYNVSLARQVAMGSQLRLRFKQEAKLLRKSVAQAFADAVSTGITKGMSEGLRHGVEHGQAQLNVESIEAYDPKAEAKFVAALQALKDLKATLGRMPHNIYATSAPTPLSSPSLCTRRSDGVPVSVPTMVPQGLALLLADAATQTEFDDT